MRRKHTHTETQIEIDRANFVLHLQLLDHQQNYVSILTNDLEHIISKHSSTFVYTTHSTCPYMHATLTQSQQQTNKLFGNERIGRNDSAGIEMVARKR